MDRVERAVVFVERHALFFVVAGMLAFLAVILAGVAAAGVVRWVAEFAAACR